MSEQHLYIAVERLTLGQGNWDTLVDSMKAKGQRNQDPNPSLRNHWRESLDGSIWIFEAAFESENIDSQWFIDWMAVVFSILPELIGDQTGYNQYGRFSTFSYPLGLTNRVRIGVFGFVQGQGWPSYLDSRIAVGQYLIDNAVEWDETT